MSEMQGPKALFLKRPLSSQVTLLIFNPYFPFLLLDRKSGCWRKKTCDSFGLGIPSERLNDFDNICEGSVSMWLKDIMHFNAVVVLKGMSCLCINDLVFC